MESCIYGAKGIKMKIFCPTFETEDFVEDSFSRYKNCGTSQVTVSGVKSQKLFFKQPKRK